MKSQLSKFIKSTVFLFLFFILLVFNFSCCKSKNTSDKEFYEQKELNEIVYTDDIEIVESTADAIEEPVITEHNTEGYDNIQENEFKTAKENPLSTFSIDVDNASYTNVRRMINDGQMPPKGSIRIEEMINYFSYDYPNPTNEHPFSVNYELSETPWNSNHQLLRIGIQGKKMDYNDVKPSNLVFLIDTSGSMGDRNKLPLLIRSFKLLTENLHPNSKVAIVTYAGSSDVVLNSTSIKESEEIIDALNSLQSGGSTNGADGIETAYEIAKENHIEGGNNRVILATDGDFNIGNTSRSGLVDLIQEKAKENIFLTICGFGMGNYKDGTMEAISNKGNGNYFYIDEWGEAQKVFKKELIANFFTIAKDVKIQIEFNPNTVKEYRLIGYENRLMNKEDFNDDTKDAGELGAGHNVTALYEIVPINADSQSGSVDSLKYQKKTTTDITSDLVTLKLRYKPLNSSKSKLISKVIQANDKVSWENASDDQHFTASVAGFGLLLRESKYAKSYSYDDIKQWAKQGMNNDAEGYRSEFISLVRKAEDL